MKVPYIDLVAQNKKYKKIFKSSLEDLINKGDYIIGSKVNEFEKKFSNFIQSKYSVGVGNGTDALFLSLKYLGIGKGDEVITAPNSYLSSASSIALTGAKPVFVDVNDDLNINPDLIQGSITKKTRAIVPVHLTGKPAIIDQILKIAKANNIKIIEDCAQAVGAKFQRSHIGNFGISGCFSLHPLKNLNALGDGGIISTNNKKMYHWLLQARNHGHLNRNDCSFWSHNMRLDTLQASFLIHKLKNLKKINKRRREIANIYKSQLADILKVPSDNKHTYSVYHTYICKTDKRDELVTFLKNKKIETKIHYPIPIHLMKVFNNEYKKNSFPNTEKLSKMIISLPIGEYLTNNQIEYTITTIKKFFK